jgi:membrane carboxypeptidase/penicillin-binding protein
VIPSSDQTDEVFGTHRRALRLNSVYLGRGSWGIELAARGYFGKPAKELTLEEGGLLAGLRSGLK